MKKLLAAIAPHPKGWWYWWRYGISLNTGASPTDIVRLADQIDHNWVNNCCTHGCDCGECLS